MLGWIDTHCHLNYKPIIDEIDSVLDRAKLANVKKFVCISTQLDTAENMIDFAKQIENCSYTIGHHPCQEDLNPDQVYKQLDELLVKYTPDAKSVGIGETGLDCNNHNLQAQKEIFAAHLELSVKYDLPVVVHSREMDVELLASLKDFPKARGVLHCWTGKHETAIKAIELGWKISFSGILTFKKKVEYLQEMAAVLPLESIVIETDAPYLAPDPYRGKSNEPGYVSLVGKKLASLRCMSEEKLQEQLWKNSHELFKI